MAVQVVLGSCSLPTCSFFELIIMGSIRKHALNPAEDADPVRREDPGRAGHGRTDE